MFLRYVYAQTLPQREYPLREVFNGLQWMVRTGTPWRMIANDLPLWHTIYEQTQRRKNNSRHFSDTSWGTGRNAFGMRC